MRLDAIPTTPVAGNNVADVTVANPHVTLPQASRAWHSPQGRGVFDQCGNLFVIERIPDFLQSPVLFLEFFFSQTGFGLEQNYRTAGLVALDPPIARPSGPVIELAASRLADAIFACSEADGVDPEDLAWLACETVLDRLGGREENG